MKKQKGFTLPEILITVVVIGIIAAITINIINTNVRKAEIESKLKQTYAILNNAMYHAVTDNGPATSWPVIKQIHDDTADKYKYYDTYLSPYIRTLRPRQNASFKELGYKDGIKSPNGQQYLYFSKNYSQDMIFLSNGTIIFNTIFVAATTPTKDNPTKTTVVNIKYSVDLNGPKGPNVVGRDVFLFSANIFEDVPKISMFGVVNTNVYTYQTTGKYTLSEYSKATQMSHCKTTGDFCGALIQKNGWKIPKDYPIKI